MILFLLLLGLLLSPSIAFGVLAFPSAEGFGKDATGGRGGVVCQVKNLDNDGSESLRECLEVDSGARTIVFRIGGTINITSAIDIDNGDVTVAGQTAPGDGILLKGGSINVKATNVIIRHIRIRPGLSIGSQSAGSSDALQLVAGAGNVIMDHLSLSWAQDEVWSIFGSVATVTLQHSIITEPLHCANHDKGCHGKCILIGFNPDDVTIHHNLISHCSDRTPEHQGGTLDWVNNVTYHYPNKSHNWGSSRQVSDINIVGNRIVQKSTDNSTDKPIRLNRNSTNQLTAYLGELNATGNIDNIFRTLDSDTLTDNQRFSGSGLTPIITGTRFTYPQVNTTSAAQSLIDVKANAGANTCTNSSGTFVTCQDSIDSGIISNLTNDTGAIICPTVSGGCVDGVNFTYPTINDGTAYTDNDSDGMSDVWETANGLNTSDATDRNGDCDGDSYTNLEEYLNQTDPGCATPPVGEAFTQEIFRFYEPNRAEGAQPQPEDQNTSIPSPGRIDLRIGLSCTGGDCVSKQFDLYCRENNGGEGTYTLVTADCTGAMSLCLGEHTEIATGTVTTNQLTVPGGQSFVAGSYITGNPPPPQYPMIDLADDDFVEYEFAIEIGSSQAVDTTYDCRLEENGGTDLDAYDVTPRITIRNPQSGGQF